MPTAASAAAKHPVYLHWNAERHDHFTSASASPPANYVSLGLQGYLPSFDPSAPTQKGAITLGWYV